MRSACALCLMLAVACAHDQHSAAAPLPNPAEGRSLASDETTGMPSVQGEITSNLQVEAVSVQAAPPSRSFFSFGGSSAGVTAGNTSQLPGAPDTGTPGAEMIDIEARFAVQCDSVNACGEKFRALVRDGGGRITSDEATAGPNVEITFEVRVPVDRFETFEHALVQLGPVEARDVKRRDVGKQYHDSELLLHEREAALKRYEDLLKDAKNVAETMQVEQQLDRIRTEVDRIHGDMIWLKDRVASATVRVKFFPSATAEDAVFAPTATLYPTIRTSMLFDLRSETQRYGYIGGGFSVQFKPFARAITLDVDIAHAAMTDRPTGSDYAYLFLAGIDLYSELLGGGRRKFFNPYLGFRTGYAITNGLDDFAFGGVVGVDLIKTKVALLDLSARVLGLVGNAQGPHIAVGPTVSFSFAF